MDENATKEVSFPVVMAVAVTRALGGIGVGLLLADRLDRQSRRVVGTALLAGAVASTFPLLRCVCMATCCRPAPDTTD